VRWRNLTVVLAVAVAGVVAWDHFEDRSEGAAHAAPPSPTPHASPGLRPAPHRAIDLYAHDRLGMIRAVARRARPLVYVPNSEADSVDVIDPRTFRRVEHFSVGALPQHVTPAYDLATLYVDDDVGNTLTPINPRSGRPGTPIPVDDPYNLYFTPNGRYAIVVAERLQRLDFRNPHTFRLVKSVPVPCAGVNHMDFSADGAYAVVSCASQPFATCPAPSRRRRTCAPHPTGRRSMWPTWPTAASGR
jgi:hypothetical protein